MTYRPGVTIADLEREAILGALMFHGGNRTRAADAVGVSTRTMQSRIALYKSQGYQVAPPAQGQVDDEPEKAK